MITERIEEYKLITGDSAPTLNERVTALIAEGWQPLGGPIYCEAPRSWAQAMIKVSAFRARSISKPLAITKKSA